MQWEWETRPLHFKDKCIHCRETLRLRQDGGVIIWNNGERYHLDCLLNWLAAFDIPPLVRVTSDVQIPAPGWGSVLGGIYP